MQIEPAPIAAPWARIEAANEDLPSELRGARRPGSAVAFAFHGPPFEHGLVAPDGTAVGFNGDGIRDRWPEPNPRRSDHLWMRWREGAGHVVQRRVASMWTGVGQQERHFDESRIDRMLPCPVTAERIRPRTVARRRLCSW